MSNYGGQAKYGKPKQTSTIPEPIIDIEAEMSTLGAIFVDPIFALDLLSTIGLRADDFYREGHREIFRAVQSLHADGVGIDAVTVANRMKAKGTLALIESGAYITRLAADVPSCANVVHYGAIVQDLATRREALALLQAEAARISDLDVPVETIRERVARQWPASATTQPAQRADEAIGARLASMEREAENPTQRVLSSIPTLNDWHGGYSPHTLTYIAGRPGMGKTGFILQELMHAAGAGAPSFFSSAEMTTPQLVDRMLGTSCGVPTEAIGRGRLDARQWSKIHNGIGDLASLPFWIDDRMSGIEEICASIRAMHKKHGVRIAVVDYVQILRGPSTLRRGASAQERVTAISVELATLKREIPIALVVAAQLNRNGEGRPPVLTDLKDSGQLEQDADKVIFLYRPGAENPNADQREATIIVAKCRGGRTGPIPALWDGPRTMYTELAQTGAATLPPPVRRQAFGYDGDD